MKVELRIAGFTIRVDGLSASQGGALLEGWPELARPGSSREPHLEIRVQDIDAGAFTPEVVTDGDGPVELTLDIDYHETYTEIRGRDLMGRLAWESDTGLVGTLHTYRHDPDYFRGVLENFLRVAVAHALVLKGGVLVHGAVVYDVDSQHSRLFFGPSGAGKSTVSKLALAAGRRIASDDLNPVVPAADAERGFLSGGSPFIGDVGDASEPPRQLRAIYRLEQCKSESESDSLRTLGPAEAVASLMACVPFVNRSAHLGERLLSNLESLTASVPSYVLSFRREGSFWPLVDLDEQVEKEPVALPFQG